MNEYDGALTDVAILGSGIAGTIAALCLKRQGFSVALIDQGTHPRFALGESTTTPASLWLRVMAHRFGVPELLSLASAEALHRDVGASSGIKSNFGYLLQEEGATRPVRAWQAVIPQAFLSDLEHEDQAPESEMHYFRQDVDAWLWAAALRSGVIGHPSTRVSGIETDAEGVTLETEAGATLRARFLIDAAGHRSPTARHFGLRDETPALRTRSRSLFTHFTGVRPYEDLQLVPDSMSRWSQGTLHHFFDGGWVWVIPFGNHRRGTNPLCSVGVNFDESRFPLREEVPPEDEWRAFLDRFPAIAAQFKDAVPARPWTRTPRLQYTSARSVDDRYWLTSHSAGAVDALYSMGNINNFQTLAVGLDLLVAALRDDDLRRERLVPVEDLTRNLLRFQDRIVYGTYAALRDPELLGNWISLWSLTDTARIRKVLIPLVTWARTQRPEDLAACFADPAEILSGVGMNTGHKKTACVLGDLDAMADLMTDFAAGENDAVATRRALAHAAAARPEYGIDFAGMDHAFRRMPWIYAPLARHGLRSHGQCFLHWDELQALGLADEEGGASC